MAYGAPAKAVENRVVVAKRTSRDGQGSLRPAGRPCGREAFPNVGNIGKKPRQISAEDKLGMLS